METLKSAKQAAAKTAQATSAALEHENTKATFQWIKEIANSQLVKDAAAGAAVGALISVPIPLIGPAIGAVLGAVLGLYKNLTRHQHASDTCDSSEENERKNWMKKFDYLIQLDQLRRNGIVTDAEFQAQKSKFLNKNIP